MRFSAKVVEFVQDFEAEQEFFTDLASVVNVFFKAVLLRWPSKRVLMEQFSNSVVVNVRYGTLRNLFPTWNRHSMRSFLHHYSRYEFMSATREKDNAISHELAGWLLKVILMDVLLLTANLAIQSDDWNSRLRFRDCAANCDGG